MIEKKNKLISFCLCALLIVGASDAKSGNPEMGSVYPVQPRIESVGVGAIPRGVVASMAQDKAGFMWLATGDGLVRYDGYRFRPQEFNSPDRALRNLGWIRALLPSRDGRLWIGTETRGLAVYDPATDAVHFPAHDADTGARESALAEPTVRALVEAPDGGIWVGSMGGGLTRFEPGTNTFATYTHDAPGGLPDARVLSLLFDQRGDLWVGTWSGLFRKRLNNGAFEPVTPHPEARPELGVQALMETSDGYIWLGTKQGDVGRVDPETGSMALLTTHAPGADVAAGSVSSFVELPGGEVWVGRSTGLDVHDMDSGDRTQSLRHQRGASNGLAGNEVTALMRDRAGWIWIAGLGLGLQRHDPNNKSLWVRGGDVDESSPMAQPDLRSLAQLDTGEIWAGTQTSGVAILGPDFTTHSALRPVSAASANSTSPASVPREARSVSAVAQAGDGTVWVASDGWLYQFDRGRTQLNALALNAGTTHRLVPGEKGIVWVCTQNGLYRLRSEGASLEAIRDADGTPFVGDVMTVALGPDHALWVGTVKGLYRMKTHDARLEAVNSAEGAGLGNPIVLGLLWDEAGTLWLDTAVTGLHRMVSWDGTTARFDRISQRHGVVSRPFGVNLMQDGRGRIWSQLYVYDPAADTLDELTAVDGVDIGTPWFFSFTKTQDGLFLFGGSDGLLVVKPENFNTSSYEPPIVLSGLRIDNVPRNLGGLAGGLTLAPHERGFSVEFAALDFTEPARLRYAYRLEGVDAGWIEGGADLRTASYGNLDPGRYTLRVKGSNRHGVWSPHTLTLPVMVLPAWWEAWWFRVSGVLTLCGLLYVAVLARTRHLERRQLVLEQRIQERTAALAEASLTDPLTGMRNRRFLTEQIASDADLAVRHYRSQYQKKIEQPADGDLIFFLIDIDHFKRVNDRLGHAAGDAVLTQMPGRITSVFRETDYMVRWGGEEFLIVARATSRDHASDLAERARQAVCSRPFVLNDGHEIFKTCSIGFACFPLSTHAPDMLSWSETIALADKCLYQAKRNGRNGWMGLKHAGTLAPEAVRASLLEGDFSNVSDLASAIERSDR